MRRGIALLITLFFIIAITVAVGISLSQFQQAREEVASQQMMVQTALLSNDVLRLVQQSGLLQEIKDAVTLQAVLEGAGVLPFDVDEIEALIHLESAAGRYNINALATSTPFQEAFVAYLQRYQVQDPAYLSDLLFDNMSGNQEYYKTDMFERYPLLYRERIASMDHLQKILDYYVQQRYDPSVFEIPWAELVRFDEGGQSAFDVNYLSSEGWMLLDGTMSPDQAVIMSEHEFPYLAASDLGLSEATLSKAQSMGMQYFVPQLQVTMLLRKGDVETRVVLDYAIETKKVKVIDYVI